MKKIILFALLACSCVDYEQHAQSIKHKHKFIPYGANVHTVDGIISTNRTVNNSYFERPNKRYLELNYNDTLLVIFENGKAINLDSPYFKTYFRGEHKQARRALDQIERILQGENN